MTDLPTAAQDLLTDYRERGLEAPAWNASVAVGDLNRLAKLTADYIASARTILSGLEGPGVSNQAAADHITDNLMDEALDAAALRYFRAALTAEILARRERKGA